MVIGVEAYDAAETIAADRFSNRILQAFYPEMFASLGYPARVKSADQLWRYIDVMHETRTTHNIDYLLRGLTADEFELFKRVTRMVDDFAKRQFGFRTHPTAALLRAIHVLRLIKIVTGNERPTVLEVGPGCGYLGMLLVLEGYPYVGTDVVQAFYLYQSHMLSLAATNFRELAGEGGNILSLEQPKPGTAVHIPWWKWVTLTPEKVKLSAGIMTSNHVMCEMHQSSMAYMAVIGNRVLSNHPGGGKFIFENWGYDLLHSKESVANKFAEHGLRLCHDEYFMSAMVLAEEVERWQAQTRPKQAPARPVASAAPQGWVDSWPRLRRLAGATLRYAPKLKRRAIYAVHAVERLFQRPSSEPLPVVGGPKGDVFPLSKQMTEGRNAVIARATVHEPELQAFLEFSFRRNSAPASGRSVLRHYRDASVMASQMGRMAPQQTRLSFFAPHQFIRSFAWTFHFLVDQTKKTMRRPSRILFIPFSYLIRWLIGRFYSSGVPMFLSRILPNNEVIRQLLINCYFELGNRLLQEDRPSEAWEWHDRCLQESTNSLHFFVGAVGLFHGLGRFREALALLVQANELRQQDARELGVTDRRYRLLDQFWAGNFGHSAVIDYVVKLGILEGRSRDDTIFFVPPQAAIANRCLMEQWRPHLTLIEREEDLPFPANAVSALRFDYLGPRLDDGSTSFLWDLAAKTYRRWYAEKRPPLLALPSDVEERGRSALRSKGLPDDAWFVGMHVREAGSKRHHNVFHRVLNADVMSFLPAIAEITKRGGWVIRMGDPSMVPLPPIPNVVDYCHSDLRSDWMDVFIAARCRFFLGTSSGPAYLPPLYGLPSVLTNWWPPAQRPWHPTDIFIPKLVRRDDGRLLSLTETLTEPFSYCHSLSYLHQVAGVYVEDNDAEDIRAAVAEMFDRVEGSVRYDAEDVALRDRADLIYDSHDAFGMAQLSREFVKRHAEFVR